MELGGGSPLPCLPLGLKGLMSSVASWDRMEVQDAESMLRIRRFPRCPPHCCGHSRTFSRGALSDLLPLGARYTQTGLLLM